MAHNRRAECGDARLGILAADWADGLVVMAGLFLAGLLRGFTGFGLALAAVPMLALVLPPQQVIPVITTAQFLAGMFDLPQARREADWPLVGWLGVTMALATPVGFLGLVWFADDTVRLAIGILVAGSVLALWRGVRVPERPSRALTLGVGVVSGLMNGLAAMAGPAVVVYLLAQHRPTTVVRASLIGFFALTAVAALVPLVVSGLANWETTLWTLIGMPSLMGGQYLGGLGFRRSPAWLHRRVALLTLAVLAVVLMLRAVL